jgi:hypothetical protein
VYTLHCPEGQKGNSGLKPDGMIILFWPAEKNLSRWILGPIESFVTGWRRAKFTFFPGEITRLKSKHQAQLFLEREGFTVLSEDLNWRTAFIHVVIVATKCSP